MVNTEDPQISTSKLTPPMSCTGHSPDHHTHNTMRELHPRAPGTRCLQDPRIFTQLITDNIHVRPGAMRILALCKSVDPLLLIMDAIAAADQPENIFDGAHCQWKSRTAPVSCRTAL